MSDNHKPSDLQQLQRAIARARNARLPIGGDFHYYNSFKSFKEPVHSCLQTIKSLLTSLPGAGEDLAASLDDKDDAFACVTTLLDDTLEQADTALDEAKKALQHSTAGGFSQVASPTGASAVAGQAVSGRKRKAAGSPTDASSFLAQQSLTTDRPQDRFDDAVDNSNTPFRHNLQHINAYQGCSKQAPIAQSRQQAKLAAHAQKLRQGITSSTPAAFSPLAAVLSDLSYQPQQLQATLPQTPKALNQTPITYIDTAEQLEGMVRHLATCTEVAVDLEHHHYRSFQGFTCLLQISSRTEDFVVDPLALRSHLGAALTPIFANPKIVKVLHGADKDILWLQRDFGLYVANMFDTGQASRVLEYPGHGLAYLLQHLCQVKTDKKYQLADWRVRPLPEELLVYARMDTHYLLFIYDSLKAELVKQGAHVPPHLAALLPPSTPDALAALATTQERSKQLCLQMYEKELFAETSYRQLALQFQCNPEQLAVFAGLFAWRDSTARREDESSGYVLSRHLMQKLAIKMPTTANQVKGLCNARAAPLVAKHAAEIAQIVVAAKEQAPLFAQQAKQVAEAKPQTHSQTLASPMSDTDMMTSPQGQLNVGAEHDVSTSPGAAKSAETSNGTAAQQPSSIDAQQAQQAVTPAAGNGLNLNSMHTQHAKQATVEAANTGAVTAVPPPVKRRAVKPITMAKGSLSFLPKRPAPAPAAVAAEPPVMAEPVAPATTSTQTAVPVEQQAHSPQPPLPDAQTDSSTAPQQPKSPVVHMPTSFSVVSASDAASSVQKGPAGPAGIAGIAGPAGVNIEAVQNAPVPSSNLQCQADSTAPGAQPQAGSETAAQQHTGTDSQAAPAATCSAQGSQPSAASSVQGSQAAAATSTPVGMAAMLGRAVPKPAHAQLQTKAGGSSLFGKPSGLDGKGTQGADSGADAVQRLRAQFTLPFARAPAEMPAAVKKNETGSIRAAASNNSIPMKATEQEAAGNANGPSVRAVVTALHASSPSAETQGPATNKKRKERDDWHTQDFLPLPLSESYKMPTRKQRGLETPSQSLKKSSTRQSATEAERWLHDKHTWDDPTPAEHMADDPAAPLLKSGSSRDDPSSATHQVQQAYRATGLDSGSDAEEEQTGQQQQQQQQQRGSVGRKRKQQSMGDSPSNPFDSLIRSKQQSSTAYQADAVPSGLMTLQTVPRDAAEASSPAAQPVREGQRAVPVVPFDYTAARARAPGLEISLGPVETGGGRQGGRGRGRGRGQDRGRGGRGGRGQGRGAQTEPKPSPAGAFNPYGVRDEDMIKGGKRSSVNPRSGNRSQSFAG